MRANIGCIRTGYICSKCKAKRSVSFLGKIIALANLGNLVIDECICSTCDTLFDLEFVEFRYLSGLKHSGIMGAKGGNW